MSSLIWIYAVCKSLFLLPVAVKELKVIPSRINFDNMNQKAKCMNSQLTPPPLQGSRSPLENTIFVAVAISEINMLNSHYRKLQWPRIFGLREQ